MIMTTGRLRNTVFIKILCVVEAVFVVRGETDVTISTELLHYIYYQRLGDTIHPILHEISDAIKVDIRKLKRPSLAMPMLWHWHCSQPIGIAFGIANALVPEAFLML